MSLLDIIEDARQKPRQYRKKIFTVMLVVTMGIIVAFWLSTFSAGILRPSADAQIPGPISVFSTPFVALYGKIKILLQSDNTTSNYSVYESQQ